MPFKSKAQQRFMFASEAEGELPKGTAKRWANETEKKKGGFKALPERVKKTAAEMAESVLPYRERVELYASNPKGQVYGGFYPGTGFGTFGGGVDAGEDFQRAAQREFEEESGRRVSNVRPIDVAPLAEEWKTFEHLPGYTDHPKYKERSKLYRGTRTHFFAGDLGDERTDKSPSDSEKMFKDIRFRNIPTIVKKHTADLGDKSHLEDTRQRLQRRLEVLQALRGDGTMKKSAAEIAEEVIKGKKSCTPEEKAKCCKGEGESAKKEEKKDEKKSEGNPFAKKDEGFPFEKKEAASCSSSSPKPKKMKKSPKEIANKVWSPKKK